MSFPEVFQALQPAVERSALLRRSVPISGLPLHPTIGSAIGTNPCYTAWYAKEK